MTTPNVPVELYANSLLSLIAEVFLDIAPFAAAISAFVIGVHMLRRWLGHRSASSLGGSLNEHLDSAFESRTMTRGQWKSARKSAWGASRGHWDEGAKKHGDYWRSNGAWDR